MAITLGLGAWGEAAPMPLPLRDARREDASMTTINSIAVAMFSVADQDAAVSFYTDKLGWTVVTDTSWGGDQPGRWVEVAPPGSVTRLALNEPMGDGEPGGGAIGVETPDLDAEYERMRAVGGLQLGEPIGGMGPVPRMFSVTDPDGNSIWVVQADSPAGGG
jgi:catechol 2,3-dioxygenase-like lactoylglutathione lyase family enzyme